METMETIYLDYTAETRSRYIFVQKGRKYTYVHINSVLQGHIPVVLKYAVSDTDCVLADVKTNEGKYIDFAANIHFINDGDYDAAIEEAGIIRPLAVIKEAAIQ